MATRTLQELRDELARKSAGSRIHVWGQPRDTSDFDVVTTPPKPGGDMQTAAFDAAIKAITHPEAGALQEIQEQVYERRVAWDAGPYDAADRAFDEGYGEPGGQDFSEPSPEEPVDPTDGAIARLVREYGTWDSGARHMISLALNEAFRNGYRDGRKQESAVAEVPDSGNPKDAIGDTKPQLHLVPAALTIEVARAMEDGARKYGPYNWRENPVRMTVYLSAIERHLAALKDGENVTRDSGVKHLAAIGANVAILLDSEALGVLIDDRSTAGPAGDLIERYTESRAA